MLKRLLKIKLLWYIFCTIINISYAERRHHYCLLYYLWHFFLHYSLKRRDTQLQKAHKIYYNPYSWTSFDLPWTWHAVPVKLFKWASQRQDASHQISAVALSSWDNVQINMMSKQSRTSIQPAYYHPSFTMTHRCIVVVPRSHPEPGGTRNVRRRNL